MQFNLQDTVSAAGKDLALGQSRRSTCPVCHASHEQSFVITRDAYQPSRLWFKCYRAKCGARGYVRDDNPSDVLLRVGSVEPGVAQDADPDDFQPVPQNLYKDLETKYSTPFRVLTRQNMRYDPQQHALVLPVINITNSLDRNREQVGWQHRKIDEKGIRNIWLPGHKPLMMGCVVAPRASSRMRSAGPQKYTDCGRRIERVVLVENLFSAYRIAGLQEAAKLHTPTDGIALLGHRLSGQAAAMIASHYTDALVLLDKDTWPAGPVAVLQALAPYNIKAEARFLQDKPKDAAEGDLLEVLKSRT